MTSQTQTSCSQLLPVCRFPKVSRLYSLDHRNAHLALYKELVAQATDMLECNDSQTFSQFRQLRSVARKTCSLTARIKKTRCGKQLWPTERLGCNSSQVHANEMLECNIIRCHAETLSGSDRRAHIDVGMRLRWVAEETCTLTARIRKHALRENKFGQHSD